VLDISSTERYEPERLIDIYTSTETKYFLAVPSMFQNEKAFLKISLIDN
jgi:hypothetical protein